MLVAAFIRHLQSARNTYMLPFCLCSTELYGKKPIGSTSTKVLMLCGSIYKRLFDSTSSTSSTSSLLSSPRSRYSDESSNNEKECLA
ncbi:hypothetical protein GQ600_13590 [Phytophthora cactorum]|nr:hypothetical protein GQ600_13590 [Phytophthora cactorum]